jgi:glycine cleavage system H lipoate-binding protein
MDYPDCYIKKVGNQNVIGFKDEESTINLVKDAVFFEFSVEVGAEVKIGDRLLVIETMKGTTELTSKISGKIVELNQEIPKDPELLNSKSDVWLLKIE